MRSDLLALLALGALGAACSAAPKAAPRVAWDKPPEVEAIRCPKPAEPKDEDLLPLRCARGDVGSCLLLFREPRASEGDRLLALQRASTSCAAQPCACSAYGQMLAADDNAGADAVEAVRVLREACVAGVDDACWRLDDVTRACAWGEGRRAICDVLKQQGRIPGWIHPPAVGALALPPELSGCFRVARELGPKGAPPNDYVDLSTGGICDIDPGACRILHPPNPKGLVDFCGTNPRDCPADARALVHHALCKLASGELLECGRPARKPGRDPTGTRARGVPSAPGSLCFASDKLEVMFEEDLSGSGDIEIDSMKADTQPPIRRTMWFADVDAPKLFVSPEGASLQASPDGVVFEESGRRFLLTRVAP